ncbi:TIGR03564 family F420-dependent LLM class oxidoreductase [bacterium]|nr:TIGR03564 family F420-dependent LLM class oxidoreductase [bacterium]MDB4103840.1 TIGR03564 family F420-dependent LLM class oxidoreductase [Acidimicrobiales bacterium]HAY69794.1 LLM class F420-dependent oxidoreductase [Acidimicrobiaceae bacterium]
MGAANDLGVRLGFAGGTTLTSIEEVRADASWASQVGFDSYWVSYLVGVDPLVALPVVAGDAPNIELGTSVVPTVGRHPVSMAQLARSAQQACDGRFTLGIGPSHQVVVEDRYGEQWDHPLERTREYLDVLLPLCAGEPSAATGNQITGHVTLDIPCEPVPVVLAALGPNMLELAGSLTAGTHVGQCGPRTIAEHTAPAINAAAEAANRPAPRIISLVNLCVGNDPNGIRAAASAGAGFYAALPSYRAMLDREGIDDPTDLILAGSMSEIADGLASYVAAGATDLRLGIYAPDQEHARATRDALAEWVA